MSVSSKFVSINNTLLEYLFNLDDLNSKHIALIIYLKDIATSEEGDIKYIKDISIKEVNDFLRADTKYRTARKLLEDLLSHSELFLVDKGVYEYKMLVKSSESFILTLEDVFCHKKNQSFTKIPESLLHLYPEGISTYIAIRYTHSKNACIDITRIQNMSKVKRRNKQIEILNKLENLGFVEIIRSNELTVSTKYVCNKYICLAADEIEFERRYNKYIVKNESKKKDL